MNDLQKRLRRLGLTTGRDLKNAPPPVKKQGVGIEALVEGRVAETDKGACFTITQTYPAEHLHGLHTLADWHTLNTQTLARIGNDSGLGSVDVDDYLFLDTETTGLGGGAIAFLVGIAYFDRKRNLIVHQYFLRQPAEEAAMLTLLAEQLYQDRGLVTFNGRTFDVPLLAGRFIRNRRPTGIEGMPHLDLLHPARRLWKRRLPSCRLGALEEDILGLQRTSEDVPGYLIPALYTDYLRTNDATHMKRVLYHNQEDLLSMVSLGIEIARTFAGQPDTLPVEDHLSLARWYQSQGLFDECEAALRLALEAAPDANTRYDALHGLAYLLKRAERREEALPLWEDLADLKADVVGHEELAKHYEWHTTDLQQALHWTEQGISVAEGWRPSVRQRQALNALMHRQVRIQRKLSGEALLDDEQVGDE